MRYRAKSADTPRKYIAYTYGMHSGKPLEDTTMKGLAESIAYLYHRHAVRLYESEDGKRFRKVNECKQSRFARIMSDEFLLDEHRG